MFQPASKSSAAAQHLSTYLRMYGQKWQVITASFLSGIAQSAQGRWYHCYLCLSLDTSAKPSSKLSCFLSLLVSRLTLVVPCLSTLVPLPALATAGIRWDVYHSSLETYGLKPCNHLCLKTCFWEMFIVSCAFSSRCSECLEDPSRPLRQSSRSQNAQRLKASPASTAANHLQSSTSTFLPHLHGSDCHPTLVAFSPSGVPFVHVAIEVPLS